MNTQIRKGDRGTRGAKVARRMCSQADPQTGGKTVRKTDRWTAGKEPER